MWSVSKNCVLTKISYDYVYNILPRAHLEQKDIMSYKNQAKLAKKLPDMNNVAQMLSWSDIPVLDTT